MSTDKSLYLIDGTAYVYRAFHAIRSLSNSKGLPTNAVFGFTRMLMKLLQDRAPEYVAMCFDSRGPTFRHDIYPQYKANRPPMPEDLAVQLPYIKQVTAGFNLAVIELPGYEADDIIGTLARMAQADGLAVVMVTGDKDFIQLVSNRCTIWDPMKEKTIDMAAVQADFGLDPSQIIDVMGLSGDTSDNVPGVPGIGPKTARSLIQTFGSMEVLYQGVESIRAKKQRQNLIAYKDQALLSRRLVTIDTRVPLEYDPDRLRFREADNQRLGCLFKELEFRQLQQAYPRQSDLGKKNYRAISDHNALDELVHRLASADSFALDTETTSQNPMAARLVGLSFALEADEAYYIPCAHDYPQVPPQLALDEVLAKLKAVLENPAIRKIGQNIKYDWLVLNRHGIDLAGVAFDTMVASYLIDPSKRAHNLDQIALDFLDHQTITYAQVVGKGDKSAGFAPIPIEKAVPYACEDADITLQASRVLSAALEERQLTHLMETMEMPLIPILKQIELTGICADRQRLGELSHDFETQLVVLEEQIYTSAGEEFNIRSAQQLGVILFEKLKLPVQKKTRKKTGYSTDVEVLTTLASRHELPALVLRYRTLGKLKSTYTDALRELIHPETGRIHTSFNQTVTATGRLSSSDPNLQNIPVRTEEGRQIRSAFIPQPGWLLLSADYSQIELRILAHCSADPILIQAFRDDEDIHTRTANEVFQVLPNMVDAELRRQAKAINFGIVYGMSAYGLSQQLGISNKMAKTYIDNYFKRYRGVKAFMERSIEEAVLTGRTSTLQGRIRLLPDIKSRNRTVRGFAERIAINTPIQGTAADLMKLALIRTAAELSRLDLQAAMLLSVHDEIVFEVPPHEMDQVRQVVRDAMENVWELAVPLKVNMAVGHTWAEAH